MPPRPKREPRWPSVFACIFEGWWLEGPEQSLRKADSPRRASFVWQACAGAREVVRNVRCGSRTVLAGFAQNVGSWYISGPPSQESGHSRYKPTGSWRPDITLGAEVWWQSRVERSKRWFDRILASWSGQDISPCVGS